MMLNSFQKLKSLLHHHYRDQSGAIAVEMALIMIPFVFLFLYVAELCTVIYVSASIDVAMAESMRRTSNSSKPTVTEYQAMFNRQMEQRINSLPFLVYKESNIQFDTWFCAEIADVINKTCDQSSPDNKAIAYFSITYKYDPIFLFNPDFILKNSMFRKGLYIMEHGRNRLIKNKSSS